MSDLIKREDAIKAIEELPNAYNGWSDAYDKAYIIGTLEEVPSADRPSAVDLSSVYSTAYKSGYEKGKADRPQGEWIDCEEPPSTDRNVFIAYGTDNMKSVCIGHYEYDMKLWYEDKNFFAKPIYDAMYWCEIPQFPTRMKGADDE